MVMYDKMRQVCQGEQVSLGAVGVRTRSRGRA